MNLELQTTLALILQQLADFFGLSIETVTANAPEWLAKYGRYCLWGDIALGLGLGVLIAGMIFFLLASFLACILEIEHPAPYIIGGIIIFIIYVVSAIIVPIIRCNAAPEIYGLMSLIELLKT